MKKRFLAALLSAALLIGTCMPVYATSGLENGENQEETPVVADVVDSEEDQEDPDASQTPETPETPADPVDPENPENPAEPVDPVDPENPKNPEAPVDPVDPENPENPAEPEAPAHIETCVEGCNGENCPCSCHVPGLFDRIMACNTLEEIWAIVDNTPEELLLAMTEEQIVQVEEKLLALEPEPLPEIILDENGNVIGEALADDEPVDKEPFVSEIIYPTVNFDNVAPFGDPVIG